MSEMTAKEYLETKNRMTCNCLIDCIDCGLYESNSGINVVCLQLEREYIEKAITIVQKWGEEHPVVTLMDKFFEMFPKAQKNERGTPIGLCPKRIGYEDIEKTSQYGCTSNCAKCWSQPYTNHE